MPQMTEQMSDWWWVLLCHKVPSPVLLKVLWYRRANYASSDQFWVWEKVQARDLVALPRLQMHSKWLVLLLQPLW